MPATIKVKSAPSEQDIAWFDRNVGPRNHYTRYSIGGEGWRFTVEQYKEYNSSAAWYLTVDDEKMLTYYLLVK